MSSANKRDCQQHLCNAGTVNLLRCLKQSLKFVKIKTEEKRTGRASLLDPPVASSSMATHVPRPSYAHETSASPPSGPPSRQRRRPDRA